MCVWRFIWVVCVVGLRNVCVYVYMCVSRVCGLCATVGCVRCCLTCVLGGYMC